MPVIEESFSCECKSMMAFVIRDIVETSKQMSVVQYSEDFGDAVIPSVVSIPQLVEHRLLYSENISLSVV